MTDRKHCRGKAIATIAALIMTTPALAQAPDSGAPAGVPKPPAGDRFTVGIGGGIVIVPALIYLAKMPPQQAAGTSLAALVLPLGAAVGAISAAAGAVSGRVVEPRVARGG